MIVVVRTADGFEAGHWGYTVDESDDQVGLVVSLTRIVGWTESGLPAGIHDPEARAAWYAMRYARSKRVGGLTPPSSRSSAMVTTLPV